MYIRRFTYKKEDVDRKLCTEYRSRKKCPHKICPYITERIEAGAVTYQEAVNAMVHPGCQMIRRLPQLILSYPDSFWVDDCHKSRMEFFNTRMGYSPSRNTPAYYAAMYLLTANETGIVVLPATGAVGLALMFGGAVCPIAALIKLLAGILGFYVPINLFEIGSFHLPVAVGFLLAVILELLLLFAGKYLWNLARKYINWIVSLKQNMLGKQEENL